VEIDWKKDLLRETKINTTAIINIINMGKIWIKPFWRIINFTISPWY
jgi:hypothetical protein